MQKLLILLGLILFGLGLAWPVITKLGLGQLPGDLFFKKGNFSFYFPITTCIIISIIITLILWFLNK